MIHSSPACSGKKTYMGDEEVKKAFEEEEVKISQLKGPCDA
jgi:fructose-specific component phosphotransferase system IIB-like protein